MDGQRVAAHLGADGRLDLTHQAHDGQVCQIAAAITQQVAVGAGVVVVTVGALGHFQMAHYAVQFHHF